MYTGTYKIAQRIIHMETLYADVHQKCAEYRCDGQPEITVVTGQAEIDFEQAKSLREAELEGIAPEAHSPGYLETLAVYRQIAQQMLAFDTLLFHGSAIALDGQAVLFTARSGTGKSTHTAIWRKLFGERCFMVNDDKPLLQVTGEGVLVCGTPWDGKHRLSRNCQVPLKAICILERGTENTITQLTPQEALPMLIQQSYRPTQPQQLAQMLKILDKLTGHVKFYRLQCTISWEAAKLSAKAMLGVEWEYTG